MSDDGVKDDTFIQVAKEYSEGVYASGPIDTSASSAAQVAIAAHQTEYGEAPGPFFYENKIRLDFPITSNMDAASLH